MRMVDVHVLVQAHRENSPDHAAYAKLLTRIVEGSEPFAVSELVLSGFVRIVTNRRIFDAPSSLADALEFAEQLRTADGARVVKPGLEHWNIFEKLVRQSNATGDLISDAFHAALAIEHGCVFITADSDFQRFKGVRVEHPLATFDD